MTFRPSSLILYVDDVDASTAFYKAILNADPIETFQDFSVFALTESFTVGLQSKHAIDPKPQPTVGGFEISMSYATNEEVDELHREWRARGVAMVLEPTMLDSATPSSQPTRMAIGCASALPIPPTSPEIRAVGYG